MSVSRRRSQAFSLLCTFSTLAFAQNIVTEGQFSVGANGAARYTVPIGLPKGTGGMMPSLSLVYDSQARDGLLGMGWRLTGLSTIAPCAPTMAQDGQRAALTYTKADRYCLNGERLIAVNGVYGADGTEYRTERETFARIISYGSVLNGPEWFMVQTKSGQTMEYGRTASARMVPAANGDPAAQAVRGWALNKVLDTLGNYYTITYSNSSYSDTDDSIGHDYPLDTSVFYPTRIDYTGNNSAQVDNGSGLGPLVPARTIIFSYAPRSTYYPVVSYQGGLPAMTDRLLTSIDIFTSYATNKRYGTYLLTYAYNDPSGDPATVTEAHLQSVAQCIGPSPCLAPIKFSWQPGTTQTNVFQATAADSAFPGAGADYQHYFVDVNGDGKKYWIQVRRGTDEAWIGNAAANGSFTAARWTKFAAPIGKADDFEHYFADIDGDGKADWIRVSRSTDEAWIALGQGNGAFDFWTKYTPSVGAANNYAHYFADVDGDGRLDWIQVNKLTDNAAVALATGAGNFQFWTTTYSANVSLAKYDHRFVDLNGDGKADWIKIARNGTVSSSVLLAAGNGTFAAGAGQSMLNASLAKHYFVDANGDGVPDLVEIRLATTGSGYASMWYAYGKGNGKFGPWSATRIAFVAGAVDDYFAPINGDAVPDWIQVGKANGQAFLSSYPSKGDTFQGPYQFLVNAGSPDNVQFFFEDLNGDGKADWIEVNRQSNLAAIRLATADRANRIVSVTNGYGLTTSINYKPLFDATVYTSDSTATAPVRDVKGTVLEAQTAVKSGLQPALHLVSSVSSDNGIGGKLTTNYTYAGLKTDTAGRGLQGFRWMQSTQVETGISSYTEFRQDWPFTGLSSIAKKTLNNGESRLLAQVTNTYDCMDFASTTGCNIAVGRRYFPYLSQSTGANWDLNGAALPGSTSTVRVDAFGNALQTTVTTSDGFSKTTTRTFNNDITNWRIGQTLRETITSTGP